LISKTDTLYLIIGDSMLTSLRQTIAELLVNKVAPPKHELFRSRHDISDPRIGDYLFSYEQVKETQINTVAVLLSVPQDLGVARNGGRAGAAAAPYAILQSLYKLTPFNGEDSLFDTIHLIDAGTLLLNNLTLEEGQALQENVVFTLLEHGFIPIIVGGGHEIAYPNGAAIGLHAMSFGILNFDAHTDVRPLLDERLGHSGSPFRQIAEREDIAFNGNSFVEFGIQPCASSRSHCDYIHRLGGTIMTYTSIRQTGFHTSLQEALRIAENDNDALYVSFDIDAIASAYAPGVSAPAAVGFTADEFIETAYMAGKNPKTRLVDFVEMNPLYDIDNRTAKLVALGIASFCFGLAARHT
jgi:formiminoglutamase